MGQLRGMKELREFRAGKKLARSAAIKAKCTECMNEWADGAEDCRIVACPLYAFMPYAGKAAGEAPAEEESPPAGVTLADDGEVVT